MNTSNISFSLAEKMAIVHALDALILADGTVHDGEINTLFCLMKSIDFDSNFIVQARSISIEQSILILKGMSEAKKKAFALILDEMAIADGYVHHKEAELITNIFASIGKLQLQNQME